MSWHEAIDLALPTSAGVVRTESLALVTRHVGAGKTPWARMRREAVRA